MDYLMKLLIFLELQRHRDGLNRLESPKRNMNTGTEGTHRGKQTPTHLKQSPTHTRTSDFNQLLKLQLPSIISLLSYYTSSELWGASSLYINKMLCQLHFHCTTLLSWPRTLDTMLLRENSIFDKPCLTIAPHYPTLALGPLLNPRLAAAWA